ncbi:hypothetical protein [Streptomyces lavendulae]|uniref:hypothetical protein n=1 Tax=Streptomyces lavendulae TaxID=1914 RepID=UPI00340942AA
MKPLGMPVRPLGLAQLLLLKNGAFITITGGNGTESGGSGNSGQVRTQGTLLTTTRLTGGNGQPADTGEAGSGNSSTGTFQGGNGNDTLTITRGQGTNGPNPTAPPIRGNEGSVDGGGINLCTIRGGNSRRPAQAPVCVRGIPPISGSSTSGLPGAS